MALLRYAAPALALASSVYGQACSVSATTTVTAAANAPTSCQTFSGSIALATGVSGDFDLGTLQVITGSFSIPSAANLSTLSGANLKTIGGEFTIMDATNLAVLDFPVLANVNSINWVTLGPNLGTFTVALTTVGTLNIRDTYVSSLTGITLTTADSIYLTQNRFLTSISMPVTSVGTAGITIQGDQQGNTAVSFPDLLTAGAIDIQNVTSLALGVLNNVTGAFSVTGNTFTSLSLPNLTSSDGFAVDNNPSMTALSLPAYTSSAAAFSIQNNTDLSGAITIPKLSHVAGAAYVVGTFNNLSMPDLSSVLGAMTIISTQSIASTCSYFDSISGPNLVIQGAETCSPSSSVSATSSGSSSGTSSTSASSSSSTGKSAAGHFEPSAASAFTIFGALAGAFELLEMLF